MAEGHRICAYQHDDHTEYMLEIRRRAKDKFDSYEEKNLYDKHAERIKPLASKDLEYIQNDNIPENDSRKCALFFYALQYGLKEDNTGISCYNTPQAQCDICYTILGVIRFHSIEPHHMSPVLALSR